MGILRGSAYFIKKTVNNFFKIGFGNRVFFKIINIYLNERSPNPKIVRIESSNFCNGKCVFCPHGKQTRKQGIMSTELYKKIIDECKRIGVREVHLQNFGEPLFDKNLFKKTEYAKRCGIRKTVIFSNGSLFDEKKITSMINSGLDEIYISFEGYSKKIFEELRPGLKYDDVSRNIKNIHNIKKKLGRSNPKVIINVVFMEKYQKLVDNLKGEWLKYVDQINFQKLHQWSDSKKNNFDKNAICNAFWNYITITWDGKVLICCLDWDAKYIVGDVNKNSIEQIWNNKKYRSFRRMVLNGKVKDIPLCKRCDLLEHENIYADFLKFSFVNSFCRWKNDQ